MPGQSPWVQGRRIRSQLLQSLKQQSPFPRAEICEFNSCRVNFFCCTEVKQPTSTTQLSSSALQLPVRKHFLEECKERDTRAVAQSTPMVSTKPSAGWVLARRGSGSQTGVPELCLAGGQPALHLRACFPSDSCALCLCSRRNIRALRALMPEDTGR